jgi:hypothetical protein
VSELRQLLERSAGTPRSTPSVEEGWRQGLRLRRRRQAGQAVLAGVAALALAVPGASWWAGLQADREQPLVFLQGSGVTDPASPAVAASQPGLPPRLDLPAGLEQVSVDAGAEGVTVQRFRDPADPSTALSLTYAQPGERGDPAALLEDLRASYVSDADPESTAEREGGSVTFPAPAVDRVDVGEMPGYLITLEEQPPAQRVLVWVDPAGAAVHLAGTGDLDLLAIAGATGQP